MSISLPTGLGPSPTELLFYELSQSAVVQAAAPGGVSTTVTFDQQMAGAISFSDSGTSQEEEYLPLKYARIGILCHAPSKEAVEYIARAVYLTEHQQGRRVLPQASSGEQFLVHQSLVNGGPNHALETEDIWQEQLYVDLMLGTDAI